MPPPTIIVVEKLVLFRITHKSAAGGVVENQKLGLVVEFRRRILKTFDEECAHVVEA